MQNVSKENLDVDTRKTNVKLIWKSGSFKKRYTESYVDKRKKIIEMQNSWIPKANHQTLGSSCIKFQEKKKNLLLTSMLKIIIYWRKLKHQRFLSDHLKRQNCKNATKI